MLARSLAFNQYHENNTTYVFDTKGSISPNCCVTFFSDKCPAIHARDRSRDDCIFSRTAVTVVAATATSTQANNSHSGKKMNLQKCHVYWTVLHLDS